MEGFKLKIEEIEKYLETIQEKIENASYEELLELEKKGKKHENYLYGYINHLKKQNGVNVNDVRFIKKEITKALKQIRFKKCSLKEVPKIKTIKKVNYTFDEEMEVLNAIYQETISNEEKKQKIKAKINEYQYIIEVYEEEIKGFSIAKKECLEAFYSSKGYYENEQKIKENKQKIYNYKRYIERCKTFLIALENKKANLKHKKKCFVPKVEKENCYYYLILKELLKSDQYYYVIAECIQNNPMFLNATYKGVSIIFEILNLYVESINKKSKETKTRNPHYYASLLQLFLDCNINLPICEQKRFMDLVQNMKQDAPSLSFEKNNAKERETEGFSLANEVGEGYRLDALSIKNRRLKAEMSYTPSGLETAKFSGNTFAFQNQKYAFSFDFDKHFNTYFCIHALDTTFIPEDSPWYLELQKEKDVGEKHLKKLSHFKTGIVYPTFTFQYKILQNGSISSFKMFDSSIEIDKIITNQDMFSYREDENLKRFAGCLKLVASDYGKEEISIFPNEIENILDFIINVELKSYFYKQNLPALYYVEEELNPLEVYKIRTHISYYLSKIPKKETEQFLSCLDVCKKNSFYTNVSLEESKIVMDSTCFIGYNILQLLKLNVNGRLTDELLNKYKMILEECQWELNAKGKFIDLEMQKRLKK